MYHQISLLFYRLILPTFINENHCLSSKKKKKNEFNTKCCLGLFKPKKIPITNQFNVKYDNKKIYSKPNNKN